MSSDETVSFSLEVNVEKAYENVRKLQTVIFRVMGLMRRMGLSEDIDAAINKIQTAITLLNQYRLTLAAAQAASGPLGWALLGISVATTMYTSVEFMESELRGR